MQYFEIEQSNEGRPVLVWHYENNRIYGTPAIAKSLDLGVLLDEEEMEHAEYLIRKHYDEMFVESALGDFMSETKNKIQKLIKNIFNGAFAAVKWLMCHKEILTDRRFVEAIEAYNGKPRIDKLLKLDKESREFVEKTFGIRINSSEEGFLGEFANKIKRKSLALYSLFKNFLNIKKRQNRKNKSSVVFHKSI